MDWTNGTWTIAVMVSFLFTSLLDVESDIYLLLQLPNFVLLTLIDLLNIKALLPSIINNLHTIIVDEAIIGNLHTVADANYDYIIVGAGSAGSVLASRLSENSSVKVLLLEAGGTENLISLIPLLWSYLQLTEMDWAFKSTPQTKCCSALVGNQSLFPRGKSLGGSSAINAMIYMRGNKRDYDQWKANGCTGWGWNDIFPYFIKAEDNQDPDYYGNGYHGVGGPLTVSTYSDPRLITIPFAAAGPYLSPSFNGPYPANTDYNAGTQATFNRVQRTIRDGQRCSASKAYLEPIINRPNLHILTYSYVRRVLFDNQKRAIGVEFDDRFGLRRNVSATKEVILSAGAINSPRILMLSGIGPADHLNTLGIPVISDLPVGNNLQDHLAGNIDFSVNASVSLDVFRDVNVLTLIEYYLNPEDNVLSSNLFEGISFVKTKYANASDDWPDIQLHFIPGSLASDDGFRFYKIQGMIPSIFNTIFGPYTNIDTFSMYATLLRPESRGTLRLASADPYDYPLLDANFLDVQRDIDILVEGMKIAIAVGETLPFQKYNPLLFTTKFPACAQYDIRSEDYLRCSLKVYTSSVWHYCGTCKMGCFSDNTTVVDPLLRVKGVSNLRVCDTSVMPTVPSGNTNAPIIALAERAADILKKRIIPSLPIPLPIVNGKPQYNLAPIPFVEPNSC